MATVRLFILLSDNQTYQILEEKISCLIFTGFVIFIINFRVTSLAPTKPYGRHIATEATPNDIA